MVESFIEMVVQNILTFSTYFLRNLDILLSQFAKLACHASHNVFRFSMYVSLANS